MSSKQPTPPPPRPASSGPRPTSPAPPGEHSDKWKLDNAAMLILRLCRRLESLNDPSNVRHQAMDFLKRMNLDSSSILRESGDV